MKIKEIVAFEVEKEVNFQGLTLLSAEEYKNFQGNISTINDWWWLRSPGTHQDFAACVNYGGSLRGISVYNGIACVRPALILKETLNVGTKFVYYKHIWTVISKKYALCDEAFSQMAFRKDMEAENANDYEASDIKKYLDNEFRKMEV